MGHAVDLAGKADEQTELGDVLDLAFDLGAGRVGVAERLPRIAQALLEAEADAPFIGVGVEHHDLHLLAGGDDLPGVDVLLGPAHLGYVDQAFDSRLELHEGAVIGDVGDPAGELGARRVLGRDALPRVGLELFHAKGDALGFGVEADHLHLDRFADLEGLGRMVDAPPGNVGDVQKPVHAAQVDEGAVVGDVLDHAFQDLAFLEVGDELGAFLGAGFLQHRPARHDDVVALPVHLEDLEGLRRAHEGGDVAHGTDIHLAAGQEGDGPRQIHDEAALDAAEYHAVDALAAGKGFLELGPRLLAARLLAAQPDHAFPVLVALDKDVHVVARLDFGILTRRCEILQGHPAFRFQADVDQHHVVVDGDHGALDDPALEALVVTQGFFKKLGEILAARRGCLVLGHRLVYTRHELVILYTLVQFRPTGCLRRSSQDYPCWPPPACTAADRSVPKRPRQPRVRPTGSAI